MSFYRVFFENIERKEPEYVCYCDGGSRGNPGPSGYGIYIEKNNKPFLKYGNYIGITTNNVAEYQSLITTLEYLKRFEAKKILIYMDSQLVVKQILGEYKVKQDHIKILHKKAKDLLEEINPTSFTISHVYRASNKYADEMANKAMDQQKKIEIFINEN